MAITSDLDNIVKWFEEEVLPAQHGSARPPCRWEQSRKAV